MKSCSNLNLNVEGDGVLSPFLLDLVGVTSKGSGDRNICNISCAFSLQALLGVLGVLGVFGTGFSLQALAGF